MMEPIGVCLKDLNLRTNANINLLEKIISYQIFDIRRDEMKNMNDLVIYAENTRSLTFIYIFIFLESVIRMHIQLPHILAGAMESWMCSGKCNII